MTAEEFEIQLKKYEEDDEVTEIQFDGIQVVELTAKHKKKLESFPDLSCLCMNNCQLKSLTNLPDIPNLTRIELMGNVFEPSEIQKLSKYKKLECVSIGDNKINSINDLKPLTGIDSIVQLDFSGTKFSET